jgi:hypothetical protein
VHKEVGQSEGEAVRPHDIYACYNCPENIRAILKYRKRAKFMSNLDQWTKCPCVMRVRILSPNWFLI